MGQFARVRVNKMKIIKAFDNYFLYQTGRYAEMKKMRKRRKESDRETIRKLNFNSICVMHTHCVQCTYLCQRGGISVILN